MFLKKLWKCVCHVLGCSRRPVYRRRRRAAPIERRPDRSYAVLRFSEAIGVTGYTPEQRRRLEPVWGELMRRYEGIQLLPLFRAVPPGRLKEIYDKEGGERKGSAPNFLQYFQVVGPHPPQAFTDIARTLREDERIRDRVDDSYPVHPGPLPQTVDTSDPGFGDQFHIHPAPVPQDTAPGGIGAEAAWHRPGSDGSGHPGQPVRFVDLERGWDLTHPDLPQPPPPVLRGASNPASAAHGTAVLGIVCARDNNNLCGVGLAPRAEVALSAYWEIHPSSQQPVLDFDDAIVAAVDTFLKEGDVLLIEAQIYATDAAADILMLPVEVHPLTFELISWAVWGRKIIVVEPGGDGTNMQFPPLDMDTWAHPVGGAKLLVRDPNHDSGAIMVSAAQPSWFDPTDIQPPPWAPVGLRIDCFAWGDGVYTCWPAAAPSPCQGNGVTGDLHTYCFSGTSAAAATIAGAAIVLQGIHRHATAGGSILPQDMRQRLGNQTPGVNTLPSVDAQGNVHRIGVMPNLAVLHQQIA